MSHRVNSRRGGFTGFGYAGVSNGAPRYAPQMPQTKEARERQVRMWGTVFLGKMTLCREGLVKNYRQKWGKGKGELCGEPRPLPSASREGAWRGAQGGPGAHVGWRGRRFHAPDS